MITTTHKTLTDQQLLMLINKNDEYAIAEFLDRYKGKVFRAILLIVKDRYIAEDIFQEAFIKIINTIRNGKYIESGKFLPWAIRVTRNMALDFLRNDKKNPKITLPNGTDIFSIFSFEDDSQTSDFHKEHSDKCKQARLLLQHLPLEQREVIALRLFGNLSFKEIADLTDVTVNTALGRMRYGLINLRKHIEKNQLAF